MKQITYLLLFLLTLTACGKTATTQQQQTNTSVEYQEPDWAMVEIESICDKDDWFHPSEEQLSDTLIAKLVDAYNCCVAWHSLYTDLDLSWRLWWNHCGEEELNDLKTAVKAMDCSMIHDSVMRGLAEAFQQSVIVAIMDTTSLDWEDCQDNFIGEIVNRYHISNFGELTEDEYFRQINYENYVKNYSQIKAKRMKNDSVHQQQLLQRINQETDFTLRSIYAMEYAHSSEDGPYFEDAIPVLVDVMLTRKYAPMLYDIWRTWRAMQCSHMGMSRDSAIPNIHYNALRKLVANTMLNHIQQHPDDLVAINEFVCLAFCDNINRYCTFPFGNQNFEEHMVMFPDHYERSGGE